jgi:hypothetical protein
MASGSYFVSVPGIPEEKPRPDTVPAKEERPATAKKPPQEGKTFDLERRPGFYDGSGGGIS